MRLFGSRRGPLVSSIAWRFSLRSARLACCTLLTIITGGRAWSMTPVLSQLRVEQKIEKENQLYRARPELNISFVLAEPCEVTVTIARHLAGYDEYKWPYLAQPFPVRTLRMGKLPAGAHSVVWDGLDEQRQPIVEVQNVTPAELDRLKLTKATPEQLIRTLPINLLQVAVEADKERFLVNFERATDTLRQDRSIRPFTMSVADRQGNYLVADFQGGSVLRYSPDWVFLDRWPRDHSRGQGYEPIECEDAGVDSKGNVFAMTGNGVYRYGAEDGGEPTPWPEQSEYTKSQSFGHLLGYKTDNSELAKKPGYAERFSGFAVDDQDNIYLGRARPDPCIQVFNNAGKFLRTLQVPEGRRPAKIRWLGNRTLAVAAIGSDPEGVVFLIDAESGQVKKRIEENNPIVLWAGPDGSFITGHDGTIVRRYTRTGDPLPFGSEVGNAKENEIRFAPHEFGLPKNAPGFPVHAKGYAITADGSVAVSEGLESNSAIEKTDLLSYSKDGTYQPQTIQTRLGQRVPGNIFLDDAPAVFDLFVTNFSEQTQPLTVRWTLTDFDGKTTSGVAPLTAQPLSRQTLPLNVNAPIPGHYRLAVEIRQGSKLLEGMQAQFARIRSRDTKENRYSPFAMCAVGEFEVMKLAGVKSHRSDSASWARQVEPLNGIFYTNRPEALQFGRGGADSLRAFARREGFFVLNGLNYGEGWLGGDWVGRPTHFVYSYDRFYEYCLRILDLFSGKGEAFYQFWNEPDNFWRPRGRFGLEHFALVQKHVWSMVKARDKDALAVADGDAGGLKTMEEFAKMGASDWNDSVQMHYPAATVYAWDNMKFPDLPETKVPAITKLVQIRNNSAPGKEVWNTEDTVPASPKTAEVAAANLPRMYISQIAAGVDKIYLFLQTGSNSSRHDVTSCLDENGHPFPTFVSYATMSHLIDGAVYAGQGDFGENARGYLFARGQDFVLAANTVSGAREVNLDVGVPKVTIVDLMGRAREVPAPGGRLRLALSSQVQYVLLPRNNPAALKIATAELRSRLGALQITAAELPARISEAARGATADPTMLNRLYHLVRAAELAAITTATPQGKVDAAPIAQAARQAVEKREGTAGYLRKARLALDWTERLAQQAERDPRLAGPARMAAQATQILAAIEQPVYPGVVVNAFIGEPGEIQQIRAIVPVANEPATSIDDKFRFEIERRPGESFDLELTVSNYYRHPIQGVLSPRLPEGWKAAQGPTNYSLEPGRWQRFLFTIQIPETAKVEEIYEVGGQTLYGGSPVKEIHASRVKL
jgi:alpha-galactosidase-like protein